MDNPGHPYFIDSMIMYGIVNVPEYIHVCNKVNRSKKGVCGCVLCGVLDRDD